MHLITKIPATLALGAILFSAGVFSSPCSAEELCSGCGKVLQVTGRFEHGTSDTFLIQGAQGKEAAFKDDIHGPSFTLTVPDMAPGKYSVDIGLVELGVDQPGRRVFDILCGDQVISNNLDIFSAAGGINKVLRIHAMVDYPGDAAHGPFAVRFVAQPQRGDAKLNTFEVRDSTGTALVSMKATDLIVANSPKDLVAPTGAAQVLWKDPSQPLEVRVKDLISRMSLPEKAAQMRNTAPSIPRIGLPAYDYWNECLHGVARSGVATVFPQAIGMAAMWNAPLLHDIADTIATEARAKNNEYMRNHDGNCAKDHGLTFWTPNINIFRDPRWGRGQETYGEDTFLTGQLAVAFIRGLQGDDPKYAKAMACAKHFAVHSGPESTRHTYDAQPPERDFYETYLPHFEAAVREGKVWSVMGAYNSVYGVPACASKLLLTELLRNEWGFQGHVVSDCGAISDVYSNHKFVPSREQGAAAAVEAGCDLCCGNDYGALSAAVADGFITEAQIDVSLSRLLRDRIRLGLFDPPEQVAFARIPFSENDSPAHEALALRAARESMVLLKNNGALPLDRSKIKRIAVIGTNASSVEMLAGNYSGDAARPVTILDGIKSVAGSGIEVVYDPGCALAVRIPGRGQTESSAATNVSFDSALKAASSADVIIYVGGLDPKLEGEEMRVNYVGFWGGDRTDIALPSIQVDLLKALHATGKPVIFVNCSGSAVAMVWAAENLPAILQAWYPGEQGGRAVGEALFGDLNPAGRLPITFYRSTNDLPAFDDYRMSNRTYRYFTGKPLFAFGHGLSYTKFSYSGAKVDRSKANRADSLTLSLNVKNTGRRDGDEVVQVYFRHVKSAQPQPIEALCAFTRVSVPAGKSAPVTFTIPVERFRYWDTTAKRYIVEPGPYELLVGNSSDSILEKVPFSVQ